MLTPDQEKLKEAALELRGLKWMPPNEHYTDGGGRYQEIQTEEGDTVIGECGPSREEAAFIALANPAAILAILAQLEQVQGDARRYNLLFNIDNFCQDELWTVVDWMRGGPDDPTKADVDAALDEYAAKQSAIGAPLPPPPEAA